MAAILETAALPGVGAGLAKLDLMSFKMSQLTKQVGGGVGVGGECSDARISYQIILLRNSH